MPTRAADKLYYRVNYLFAETLEGGLDSVRPWKALGTLRGMGGRIVFDKAKSWCASPIPRKRGRAAAILSQLRRPIKPKPPFGSASEPVFKDESFALIASMIAREQDLCALQSQIFAFGHLDKLDAVPIIAPYVDHPNEDIRYAVACSLGSLHEHPDSAAALAKLANDPDKDVRNWAIFGLGVLGDVDSEELSQLFIAHLDDPFLDARIEAAASLAKRHDARVAKPLLRLLRNDGPLSGYLEAARDLLEMDEDPPDWYAKEYIAALEAKFPTQAAD